MSVADEYRVKAAELAAKARLEQDPVQRAELESLERSYLRLAIQADKNADTNIVYETPPERPPERPVVQQQQQQQRQPEEGPDNKPDSSD